MPLLSATGGSLSHPMYKPGLLINSRMISNNSWRITSTLCSKWVFSLLWRSRSDAMVRDAAGQQLSAAARVMQDSGHQGDAQSSPTPVLWAQHLSMSTWGSGGSPA